MGGPCAKAAGAGMRRMLFIVIVLLTVAGLAGFAPASAAVRPGAGAAGPGRPGQAAGPSASGTSAQCVFFGNPDVTTCASTDPTIEVQWTSYGDTTGCTFSSTLDWGDGTSTSGTATGGPSGSTPFASHSYKSAGTYTITWTGSVLSGGCEFLPATGQFTLDAPGNGCPAGQPSGPSWVSKYPASTSLSRLAQPFRSKVERFITAMTRAGISEVTILTYRPAERAYLMHYAWQIAHHKQSPQSVPAFPAGQPYPGKVAICWVHRKADGSVDLTASVQAAAQMVAGYRVDPRNTVAPAYPTMHTPGLAIDMTTTWTRSAITIVNGSGHKVTISSSPHTGLNPTLIAVGATYGVIHFKNAARDPNHWSSTGK